MIGFYEQNIIPSIVHVIVVLTVQPCSVSDNLITVTFIYQDLSEEEACGDFLSLLSEYGKCCTNHRPTDSHHLTSFTV